MIGIFDSGSGGLTFYNEVKKLLPEYDYIYFGDYKNCPYGNKNSQEIIQLTTEGVLKLKNAGVKIIILACNTATANAIKILQKNEKILGVKILGVTIPGAEKIFDLRCKKVVIFATKSSVNSLVYTKRIHLLDENIQVQEIALPELAGFIEQFLQKKISRDFLEKYIQKTVGKIDFSVDAIVLGCTHYSYIIDIFEKIFPQQKIVNPSYESALQFVSYLERHPEIEKMLSKNQKFINIS
ncbi:glutamate racemase [Candidatus Gracilibacteria bacterium GN02-873]|nr:glutamate racemase [Candidatus Gracilibacteria bacterium GN02-873]